MRTIMICGCGGSGKSELASQLGQRLNLPVILLDMEYYDEHWNPLDPELFAQRQRELVAADEWIIDGNYATTMPIRLGKAQTVIVLDIHPLVCLWGTVQRRFQHRGDDDHSRHRRGRINWGFVKYVLSYRRKMRPRVERLIAEHAVGNVVQLRNRSEIRRFLAAIPSPS